MSRWQSEFDNHPFQSIWKKLKVLADKVKADDESIVTDVEEVARFKKVMSYIDLLIQAGDPELIPASTWANFQNQGQLCLNELNNYQSNRNIGHLKNANGNLDNMLTYVRPYIVEPGQAAKTAGEAFRAYSRAVSENIENLKAKTKSAIGEIEECRQEALSKSKSIDSAAEKITGLERRYFEDSGDEQSLESSIESLYEELNHQHKEISAYYSELLGEESTSIRGRVESGLEKMDANRREIVELLEDASTKIKELNKFHLRIFGKEDGDGDSVKGLKQELDSRMEQLGDFEQEQKVKYQAIVDQIETLLPGATSAGLAHAYRALRRSFSKPIKWYSGLFYVAIVGLVAVALVSVVEVIGSPEGLVKFIHLRDIPDLLNALLVKLPIVVPVVWLAIFASRRRSEAQRLQQEYAHKEAIAKSYESFKRQIEDLGESGRKELLMERLLNAAIDAIANNASESLDKKHGDKLPLHELVEKVIPDLEKLKRVFQKNGNG